MEALINQLENDLSNALSALRERNDNRRHDNARQQAIECIRGLHKYIQEHPFASREDEILYYKTLAPELHGRLFYYLKLFQLELILQTRSQSQQQEYIQKEFNTIDKFINDNANFCEYYSHRRTNRDEYLFVRGSWEDTDCSNIAMVMDQHYCEGSYKAATFIAFFAYRQELENHQTRLLNPAKTIAPPEPSRELRWTDKAVNLVELLNGLHECGCFNNGKADIKQIVSWMEQNLGVNLTHHYNTFKDITHRKKEPTKFLDEVKEKLQGKIDRSVFRK